jgi:hypothetical protein
MSLPPLPTKLDEYMYQGISGPLLFRSDGNIGLARDRALLQEELIDMALTLWQEVFMEPEDGVGLDQFQFDPNDEDTYVILNNYLRNRMNRLDDRIAVTEVTMGQDSTGNILLVLILWRIVAEADQTQVYSLELDTGVQL